MARKRSKVSKVSKADEASKVAEAKTVTDVDPASLRGGEDVVTDESETLIEVIEPAASESDAVVVEGSVEIGLDVAGAVVGDKLVDVTGVDLTEVVAFDPMTATPEEICKHKQVMMHSVLK